MADVPDKQTIMAAARSAALLAVHQAGCALEPSELADIAHLLPPAQNAPHVTQVGTGSVNPAVREVEGAPRRIKWKRNLAEYAADWGCSPQTLKHWVRIGKKKGRIPPLDTRWALASWWAECMTIRVPDKLLEFAKERPESERSPADTQNTPTASPTSAFTVKLAELDEHATLPLQQAHKLLTASYLAYEAALDGGTDALQEQCSRRWSKAMETYRKAELSERAAKEKSGELIDRAELVADLLTFLEVLRTMRSNMPGRVTKRLAIEDTELSQRIEHAIEAERVTEDAALRQLSVLRTAGDVAFQLSGE